MLICIEISTGKLLEMQSDATPGTLIKNAISMGYTANQVQERAATQAEFDALMPLPFPPQPTIQDVVAVLSPDQQTAIQTAVSSSLLTKSPVIGI